MRNEKLPAEIISFFRVYEHAARDESVFTWELTYSFDVIYKSGNEVHADLLEQTNRTLIYEVL